MLIFVNAEIFLCQSNILWLIGFFTAGRNCRYDFVAVYAGNTSDSRGLGKFCGNTAPQPLSSLGQMYIQFWTDGSVVRKGFRAMYT